MDDPVDFDYQFRVILIGDSTVGKSSLLRKFVDDAFFDVSDPTVGVDFFARVVAVGNGRRVKLQLWDTAGQERFRSITKSYYRNSVGVVVAYDICNVASFERVDAWIKEAKRHIEPFKASFVLVGCKRDLAEADNGNSREVCYEEAKRFADFRQMPFVEASAKTGEGVEKAFSELTRRIYAGVESGEYALQDGWDGIKKGYSFNNNGLRRRSPTHANNVHLREAEVADSKCC